MYQKKKTDIDTHTIMYQANFPAVDIETIMYPANFPAPGRGLDLLLSSFLPSREEKKKQERRKQSIDSGAEWHNLHMDRVRIETKKQDRIFCPLRGHSVGRMQYAPTSCRQETLFPINSREERIETKIQEQKNRPLGSRGVLHTPHTDRVRTETKMQERIKQSIDSGAEWHIPHMNRVRIETKKQDRIFCPLRGHSVGRMLLRPTTCRQETLFPINSREERTETKIQEQKNHPLGCRAQKHTPHMDRVRTETKMQEQIFCPLRGHVVGRMQYAPTSCRQERLFPINSQEERIETKMQERRKQSIYNGAEWHTPFMCQGERYAVWRDTFLEQRSRVAVWRDRRLEERSSHARLQLKTFGENSKPYKSSLVALSEQLRDIFAA